MAEQPKNPLIKLQQDLETATNVRQMLMVDVVRSRFIANYEAVSGRKDGQARYEKELFALADIANRNPEIMQCDPMSIFAGFVKAGTTALSFSDGNKLYPIIRNIPIKGTNPQQYKKVLSVDIGAHGKREMLERMPDIKRVDEAQLVYRKDKFKYDPRIRQVIEHEFNFPPEDASEETVIGAYCRVYFKDRFEDVVITIHELKKARSKSTNVSYINNQKVKDGGELWNKFYGEAAKKTAYNRVFKVYYKYPTTDLMFMKYDEDEDTINVTHKEVVEPSFVEPDAQSIEQEQSTQEHFDKDTGEVKDSPKVDKKPSKVKEEKGFVEE